MAAYVGAIFYRAKLPILNRSRMFNIANRTFWAHLGSRYFGHSWVSTSPVSEKLSKHLPTTPPNSLGTQTAPVILSKHCIKRMKTILGQDEYLRVAVEGGGCSGFQYTFQLDTKIEPEDCVIEQDGARMVIDSASLEYLEGSTIDYNEELIRSSFRVLNNPKAGHGCSCGASFTIKL